MTLKTKLEDYKLLEYITPQPKIPTRNWFPDFIQTNRIPITNDFANSEETNSKPPRDGSIEINTSVKQITIFYVLPVKNISVGNGEPS